MKFVQHIREAPFVNLHHWAFALTGRVRSPLILNYEDVLNTPSIDVPAAIICAHQPAAHQPDDALIYDAVWRGAALSSLLEEVEIDPVVTGATLYAADGYTCNLTLDQLRAAVLVTTMNGHPLPPEHGYPARIVVPGLYGFKSPKWIERIHLSDQLAQGTWESRGWTVDGLQSFASIAAPRQKSVIPLGEPTTFHGVAYMKNRGDHLSVCLNGERLRVSERPSAAAALIEWSVEWTPLIPGDHLLELRECGLRQMRVVHVR